MEFINMNVFVRSLKQAGKNIIRRKILNNRMVKEKSTFNNVPIFWNVW